MPCLQHVLERACAGSIHPSTHRPRRNNQKTREAKNIMKRDRVQSLCWGLACVEEYVAVLLAHRCVSDDDERGSDQAAARRHSIQTTPQSPHCSPNIRLAGQASPSTSKSTLLIEVIDHRAARHCSSCVCFSERGEPPRRPFPSLFERGVRAITRPTRRRRHDSTRFGGLGGCHRYIHTLTARRRRRRRCRCGQADALAEGRARRGRAAPACLDPAAGAEW